MRCPYSFMEWNEGDEPVGGVVANNAPEWLGDELDNAIDLSWEEHVAECKAEDHDSCGPEERGTLLIGSWTKRPDGQYEPDKSGEYSAVVGEVYTQVVWSKHTRKAAWCSPCFPSQGDLDTPGPITTFDLPPNVWGTVNSASEPQANRSERTDDDHDCGSRS